MSLTLAPIQRLMQENEAGLSPQQTTRVSERDFPFPCSHSLMSLVIGERD